MSGYDEFVRVVYRHLISEVESDSLLYGHFSNDEEKHFYQCAEIYKKVKYVISKTLDVVLAGELINTFVKNYADGDEDKVFELLSEYRQNSQFLDNPELEGIIYNQENKILDTFNNYLQWEKLYAVHSNLLKHPEQQTLENISSLLLKMEGTSSLLNDADLIKNIHQMEAVWVKLFGVLQSKKNINLGLTPEQEKYRQMQKLDNLFNQTVIGLDPTLINHGLLELESLSKKIHDEKMSSGLLVFRWDWNKILENAVKAYNHQTTQKEKLN